MNDVKIAAWQEWNIDLQDFNSAGIDLTDVNAVYIGFGDRNNWLIPGGTGTVYFDDIRLYASRCVPEYGPTADFSGDCVVSFKDYAILGSQWLQPPGIPSADIAPEPLDGFVDWLDLDTLADSWLAKQLWPE